MNTKSDDVTRETPYIKYCPNCKGDLRRVASNQKSEKSSAKFRCDVCGREFEIVDLTE